MSNVIRLPFERKTDMMTNLENRQPLFTAERLLGANNGWSLIGRGHQTYVTDRFVAVRADLVSDASRLPASATPLSDSMIVPPAVPERSGARFRASVLERLGNEGISVHGDEADTVQHLYLRGEHVGWVAAAQEGRGPYMTIADRPEVEALHQAAGEVADRLGFLDVADPEVDFGEWSDGDVGRLWDLAAYLLGEIRHAQRTPDPEGVERTLVEEHDHVLDEVRGERANQDRKWGLQNHPDGTGNAMFLLHGVELAEPHAGAVTMGTLAYTARQVTDRALDNDTVTYADILLEEVGEAFAESSPRRLRAELVQVAAVAVAWIEAIDRRESADRPRGNPMPTDCLGVAALNTIWTRKKGHLYWWYWLWDAVQRRLSSTTLRHGKRDRNPAPGSLPPAAW